MDFLPLQWIQEGYDGSKLYFDFLKRKVGLDKMFGLHRVDGTFAYIKCMFSMHFHNIFYPSIEMTRVEDSKDSCHKVVPCKVFSGDWDMLDRDFS